MHRKRFIQAVAAMALAPLFVFIDQCSSPQKAATQETQEVVLSDSEKTLITAAYTAIASTADSLLMLDSGIALLSKMIPVYSQVPGIDSVWVRDNVMYVRFIKGGTMSWDDVRTHAASTPKTSVSPTSPGQMAVGITVPHRYACILVGPCTGNESTDPLRTLLTDNCYSCTQDLQFTPDFIKAHLASYDLVFIKTHGGYNGEHTKITTWEEIPFPLSKYALDSASDWFTGRLMLSSYATDCPHSGPVHYVCVTEKFFSHYLASGRFNKAVIYANSCHFLEDPSQMGSALLAVGAKAVVGWDQASWDHLDKAALWFRNMLNLTPVSPSISTLADADRTWHYIHNPATGDDRLLSSTSALDPAPVPPLEEKYSYLTCVPESSPALLDISGAWEGQETMELTQSGGCGSQHQTISGTGSCIITQIGSTLTIEYPSLGIQRTGTITADNAVSVTGTLVIPQSGVTMQKNSFLGSGSLENGVLLLTSTGDAQGTSGGVSCELIDSSTAQLHRTSPCISSGSTTAKKSSQPPRTGLVGVVTAADGAW
jgi:hypothetical protein